ncbi:MAG: GIY-YIG nuclease family protein [Candidatus Njordarchaeales archaeon]
MITALNIPDKKGSYILILEVLREFKIRVGKLGEYIITPGLYAYVGSALGPGGLKARVLRHFNRLKKKKWHIDYLTTHDSVKIRGVVLILESKKLECALADDLLRKGALVIIPKFGSTDCNCAAHLLKIDRETLLATIKELEQNFGCILTYLDEELFSS